jgi:hypothetical protein
MLRGYSFAALVLVVGVAACERRHEDKPVDTTITSGPYGYDSLEAHDGGHVSEGASVTGTTGAGLDRTMTTDRDRDLDLAGGKDGGAGVTGSTHEATSTHERADGGHVSKGSSKGNTSTTLGDGTSGQYTGGTGTYGGKATQGTGKSDSK